MSLCENSNDGRPCRDEDGEPCAQCSAWLDAEFAYWKAECNARPLLLSETNPEQYALELFDAGRGPRP